MSLRHCLLFIIRRGLVRSTGTCRGCRRPPKHRRRPGTPSLLRRQTASLVTDFLGEPHRSPPCPAPPRGPIGAPHPTAPCRRPTTTEPTVSVLSRTRTARGDRATSAPDAHTTPPCHEPFSLLDRAARARPMRFFGRPRVAGRRVARAVALGRLRLATVREF
jgi:hypothetical protein